MTPTEALRDTVRADWDAATHHPFTDALEEGSLDPALMAGYFQQDYHFIDGFVRLLASATTHAPSLADSVPAAQFLGLVTRPENSYFLRSFEALCVPSDAPAAPETIAFRALMARAHHYGRHEIMIAVLVVAEWIYLDWADPHAHRAADLPFWLGEWITLHAGDGFAGVVSYLRDQLDTVWNTLDDSGRADVTATFQETVRLDRAFFDAAWSGFQGAA